jgi:proline iminopeptidase
MKYPIVSRSSRGSFLLAMAAAFAIACDADPPIGPPSDDAIHRSAHGFTAPRSDGFLTTPDGIALYYQVAGTGPDTTVVLHGGPGLSMGYLVNNWDRLAAGRTVIYYDQRGGGHSDLLDLLALLPAFAGDPNPPTAADMVADLEAVRMHFGLERLRLVGHSWGAMLAVLYALEHPGRVDRMVLANPAPVALDPFAAAFSQNLAARLSAEDQAAIGALIPEMLFGPDPVAACDAFLTISNRAYLADPANLANHRGSWCDVPEGAARQWLLTSQVVQASLGSDFDFRPELPALSVPTLVVHGSGDPMPIGNAQAWAEIQNAELLVLEDVGHYPWLEEAPGFFTAVNTFLRRADPALARPSR